jgi:hypothetical protein
MRVADNEHTRALGIAGMKTIILEEVAIHTYWCAVDRTGYDNYEQYQLTADDLEADLDTDRDL